MEHQNSNSSYFQIKQLKNNTYLHNTSNPFKFIIYVISCRRNTTINNTEIKSS